MIDYVQENVRIDTQADYNCEICKSKKSIKIIIKDKDVDNPDNEVWICPYCFEKMNKNVTEYLEEYLNN